MGEAKSREALSENRYRARTEKMILQGGFIYRVGSDLVFSSESGREEKWFRCLGICTYIYTQNLQKTTLLWRSLYFR